MILVLNREGDILAWVLCFDIDKTCGKCYKRVMLLTSLIGGIFSVGLKAAAVAATATAATAAAAVITAPLLKFIAPVFGPFVALAGAAVMGKKGK